MSREVNQTQLAQALRLSTQQIRNLEREGLPVSRAKGRQKFYLLADAIAWYLERKKAEVRAAVEPTDFNSARARRERARARLAEMEVAKEEGRLIPRDVVEEIYGTKLMDVLRSGILNMPGRWGAQIVGLRSPREGESVLKRVASELLEEFSGSAADEILEEESAELPEDFPGHRYLVASGVETMSDLLGLEDLTSVKGIGKARAREIMQRLGA